MTPALAVLDRGVSSRKTLYRNARIPKYGTGVLQALQFSDPNTELLCSLSEPEWSRVLEFCDSSQLTLILGRACNDLLPDWVQARINRNFSDNAERFIKLSAFVSE